MIDTTFDERLSLGHKLAVGASVILAALFFFWIGQPQGDYDREPDCKSQDGKPGLVQIARPVTSDMPIICDPIMHGEHQVLPRQ